MIFVNTYGEAIRHNGGHGIHVWLEDDVRRVRLNDQPHSYHPKEPAMCGADLQDLPFPGGVDPELAPASEATWADRVMDLLEDNRMCEECRTRLAVYHGLQESVTLWAANAVQTDRCGECSTPDNEVVAAYYIEGVKGGGEDGRGIVVRQAYCPECGRDIARDELRIPEDVEAQM